MKKKKRQKKKVRIKTSSESDSAYVAVNPIKYRHHHSSISSSSSESSSNTRLSSRRRGLARHVSSPALQFFFEDKPKSIAFYIENRQEMVRHMFASLHQGEIRELLPESMKHFELSQLLPLCIEELNGMSRKRISAILEGENFVESSESEAEMNVPSAANGSFKALKAEIAVADSTTEMATSNPTLFNIHSHTGDEIVDDDAESVSPITTEVRYGGAERSFTARAVQSDLQCEQVDAMTTNHDEDDLEEGEVVSDQGMSSMSNKMTVPSKKVNHSWDAAERGDKILANDLTPSLKDAENSENSFKAVGKVRERKLNMLELELRSRAIEALIKRIDKKT